ncbi:MAG TPA: PEP-CTERM sorting domain-containing protein, partial [Gemmataceae bacterium]|nr:PEP-CTERM sorting domain-containing protein [Gemmataceae bacterium]
QQDQYLAQALSAQGFIHGNGWTINYSRLQGSLQLDTYEPWTENKPAVNEPTVSLPGAADNGFGGAALGLHYLPQGTDPTGASVHWIQLIHTNVPDAGYANAWAPDPSNQGYYSYLDNSGNAAGDPFYDPIGSATSSDFIDVPARAYSNGSVWSADVYLVTGDTAAKSLTFYDGVGWGFTDPVAAPEPASLTLLGIGALAVGSYAWRRRKRARG